MKTDLQIQSDVRDALGAERQLFGEHIQVRVASGVVSLVGHVDNFAAKTAADRAARDAVGPRITVVGVSIRRHRTAVSSDSWVDEVRRSHSALDRTAT